MKVLLVINKPNRETRIMEAISHEIRKIDSTTEVRIWEMCTPVFNGYVLKYKPDVILTFPFTCTGFAAWYYVFKLLFGCKILSLRAEGVVDLSSEYNIQWAIGFDHYGSSLVDYELFWGSQVATVIGRNLLKQGKLASMERVKIVGYPRLESYFSKQQLLPQDVFPERITEGMKGYSSRNIVFFATGFHLANYSRQDLFDAKDLDAENRIDELLEAVELTRRYRQAWTDSIVQAAEQNLDLLFVVKKHPIERRDDYRMLEEHPNILFIYEDMDINLIISFVGLFFHYGSTSLVDAYLSGVPSVYVYSKSNKSWYSDLGWPSSRRTEVGEINRIVQEFRAQGMPFVQTPEIRSVLKNVFDIEEGKPYQPSKRIAELIVSHDPAQRIPWTDKYLWKSVIQIVVHGFRPWLARTIKKILRMDPNTRLFKGKCSESVCDRKNGNQSI